MNADLCVLLIRLLVKMLKFSCGKTLKVSGEMFPKQAHGLYQPKGTLNLFDMLLPLGAGLNINVKQVMSVSPPEASLERAEGSVQDQE